MKTPMPSQYPVLENKPIDQWKVTELKEELRKRRLKTGGLKDELIRRLDESLRAEMVDTSVGDDNVNNTNGVDETATANVVADAPTKLTEQPVFVAGDFGAISGNAQEIMGAVEAIDNTQENVGNADVNDPVVVEGTVTVTDIPSLVVGDKSEERKSGLVDDAVLGEGIVTAPIVAFPGDVVNMEPQSNLVDVPVLEDEIVMATAVVSSEIIKEQQSGLADDPVMGEGIVTATDVASVMGDEVSRSLSSEKSMGRDGFIDDKTEGHNRDLGEQERSEDVKLDSTDQTNQVSEVSASLGFPSNNSVSTDSLSIVEKNDLKDNLIADNVKLESDVTLEMVLPSSSNLVPDVGELHPRDVDEPRETKVSVEETDNSVANADMSQKNYSADFGSEKLNLDRSSGDESMEEDASESKQIESNFNPKYIGENTTKKEFTQADSPVATAMETDLSIENKFINDQKNDVAAFSDKRKLSDEDAIVNKPAKRQHRWKKESNIVTETQISDIAPLASTQDVPQSGALRQSFSRSDSTVSNDPPKEREVPPSTKPATNSLRIDHFLRPFTLKAVKELLGKTGTFSSFWMDHIKTHCYITYSSIEEAVETRNAVYNLQWPPNGGRQLVAEFVDPEEVKFRLEPPPTAPVPPLNAAPTKGPEVSTGPQPSPRQQSQRQQSTFPPPPPVSSQAPVRERLHLPPAPPIERVDPSIVTLDDLFRKTKATPRIYYLPLSDEQVSSRPKNSKHQETGVSQMT